jgi:hypothetical protein
MTSPALLSPSDLLSFEALALCWPILHGRALSYGERPGRKRPEPAPVPDPSRMSLAELVQEQEKDAARDRLGVALPDSRARRVHVEGAEVLSASGCRRVRVRPVSQPAESGRHEVVDRLSDSGHLGRALRLLSRLEAFAARGPRERRAVQILAAVHLTCSAEILHSGGAFLQLGELLAGEQLGDAPPLAARSNELRFRARAQWEARRRALTEQGRGAYLWAVAVWNGESVTSWNYKGAQLAPSNHAALRDRAA